MTASLVASVKIEREQIEQLARLLGVLPPVSGSGAAVFRLCLDRVRNIAPVITTILLAESESGNSRALEALATLRKAVGGLGDADATEEAEPAPAPPSAC